MTSILLISMSISLTHFMFNQPTPIDQLDLILKGFFQVLPRDFLWQILIIGIYSWTISDAEGNFNLFLCAVDSHNEGS